MKTIVLFVFSLAIFVGCRTLYTAFKSDDVVYTYRNGYVLDDITKK